jgi:hypothetical protein
MRESMRLLLEAEAKQPEGLKPLAYWQQWFPQQYPREMLAEVYQEVQRANGHD